MKSIWLASCVLIVTTAPRRRVEGARARGVRLSGAERHLHRRVHYQDTKYATNLTGLGGIPLAPTLFQLPGAQLSNASLYTTTGWFAWTPPIAEDYSGLLYVDFRYRSALNTGSNLDAEKQQNGFILVDARIGLYGKGHRHGIELWSQTVLDQQYQ